MMKLSNRMPPCMVQISMPTESMVGRMQGALSSKKSGLAIWRGAQTPLYSGLSIFGADHLPLYFGLSIVGGTHFPQPTLQAGLSTDGASHSPSSSSSQSAGI